MWHDFSRISSALMIVVALAPQAIALAPRTPLSHLLVARQAGIGGTACTSACAIFVNALGGCPHDPNVIDCLCNNSVANGLQSCINCAVSTSPTTDVITAAGQLVTTYHTACDGISLPPITVPSGSTGGGSSTSKAITIPSTSKGSVGTTIPSTTFAPISTTDIIISATSTNVVITSVTPIISTPIVQTTIHPSLVTDPATGPTGGTTVKNSAIGMSAAPGVIALGLHVIIGCILGAF